jgi:hypothetical protein
VRRSWICDGQPERFYSVASRIGDPFQGLADHLLPIDRCAKQGGRDPRDLLLLLLRAALGGHRRRRADALNLRRSAGILEPSHEKRYVRALPSPIGVQFVQYEELQSPGRLDKSPLVRAGQHELEHHVVGKQDVGRVGDDRPALLRRLLPGVPLEGHRLVLGAEELLKLTELAVGQGVHGVDDDRLDTGLVGAVCFGFEDLANDRDDVRQALTGAGARGEHVALPGSRCLDGLLLVPVQTQLLAALQPENILSPSCNSPWPTSSETVPPDAKLGFSDSHGSGHWYPCAIRSATCSLMSL